MEKRVVKGQEEIGRKGQETDIKWEEVRKAIKKLKLNKAIGIDGIPNEMWKYGKEVIEKWVREICKKVWREERWPEEWKEGIIAPIVKKGEGEKIEEYRGVTLMSTLYKICTTVLAERLREEVEGKRIIPENQVGFKKDKGVLDNVYVLNYMIQKQINRNKGKLVCVFNRFKGSI